MKLIVLDAYNMIAKQLQDMVSISIILFAAIMTRSIRLYNYFSFFKKEVYFEMASFIVTHVPVNAVFTFIAKGQKKCIVESALITAATPKVEIPLHGYGESFFMGVCKRSTFHSFRYLSFFFFWAFSSCQLFRNCSSSSFRYWMALNRVRKTFIRLSRPRPSTMSQACAPCFAVFPTHNFYLTIFLTGSK